MFDINDTSWMASGKCADADDAEIYFPIDEDDPEYTAVDAIEQEAAEAAAVRRCYGCPVASQCLQYALELNLSDGVWGGFTPVQRNQIRLDENRERAEEDKLIPHGTRQGYDDFGCRCTDCGLAQSVKRLDRKRPIVGLVKEAEKLAASA